MALQTHDSVGNQPQGQRLHQMAGVRFQRAAAPLFLLYPAIPMIFMGEEFASDSPFMFFADFIAKNLRRSVNRGRRPEYPHHDWSNSIQPSNERAFTHSKLRMPDADCAMLGWYKRLLVCRKDWQQRGILDPRQMQIHSDIGRGLVGISYPADSGETQQSAFVVACLAAGEQNGVSSPVELSEAEILLDSLQETSQKAVEATGNRRDMSIQMQSNHAIAGFGRLIPFGN